MKQPAAQDALEERMERMGILSVNRLEITYGIGLLLAIWLLIP